MVSHLAMLLAWFANMLAGWAGKKILMESPRT
jgi:hypothetical protein